LTAAALLSCRAVAGLPQTFAHRYSVGFEPVLTSRGSPSARFTARWRMLPLATFQGEFDASRSATLGEAWFRVGDLGASGGAVEAGRQRLSYGDERLLGANREMGPSPPGWNCLRFQASRGRVSADVPTAGCASTAPR
jgi:hypothetical protein